MQLKVWPLALLATVSQLLIARPARRAGYVGSCLVELCVSGMRSAEVSPSIMYPSPGDVRRGEETALTARGEGPSDSTDDGWQTRH